MRVTLDASVFVSAYLASDIHHAINMKRLGTLIENKIDLNVRTVRISTIRYDAAWSAPPLPAKQHRAHGRSDRERDEGQVQARHHRLSARRKSCLPCQRMPTFVSGIPFENSLENHGRTTQ